MTDRPDPVARVAPLLLAALLALAGAALLVRAELVAAEAQAEEAACRAREEGLGELACMDFSAIDLYFLTLWGDSLLAGAAGVVTAAVWLAFRPARSHVVWVCIVAALVTAALLFSMADAVWTALMLAACASAGIAVGTGIAVLTPARQARPARAGP